MFVIQQLSVAKIPFVSMDINGHTQKVYELYFWRCSFSARIHVPNACSMSLKQVCCFCVLSPVPGFFKTRLHEITIFLLALNLLRNERQTRIFLVL